MLEVIDDDDERVMMMMKPLPFCISYFFLHFF